jgi:hypothetical protein
MSWFSGSSTESTLPKAGRNPAVSKVGLLVERLKNSTSLEEVLESIDQLTELSSTNPLEVGKGALKVLLVQLDGIVAETSGEVAGQIIQGILEIINIVCAVSEEVSNGKGIQGELTFSDMFLKNVDNVSNVLNLLQRKEMWVKLNGIQLLNTLHKNRTEKLEGNILQCNAGMMRLMDVLAEDDTHEKVRNDMLLLFDKLTKKNDRIKEFMAFQEGFERLFQIISREGLKSVVALDCLRVVENILEGSELTKKLFAQTPCINKLGEICAPPAEAIQATRISSTSTFTSEESVSSKTNSVSENKRCEMGFNILSKLLECNVAGGHDGAEKVVMSPLKAIRSFSAIGVENSKSVLDVKIMRYVEQAKGIKQALVKSESLLLSLLTLALGGKGKHTPVTLRVRAIIELGNIVCGSEKAQDALGRVEVVAPWGGKRMVTRIGGVSVFFSLALNSESKQIRDAAIYAISCYLEGNEMGQISIVGHAVTPPPTDISAKHDLDIPRAPVAGRILVNTLASAVRDLQHGQGNDKKYKLSQLWQTCRILESLCSGSLACKELLLRVPVKSHFETASEEAPESLLPIFFMRALALSMNEDGSSAIPPDLVLHFQVSIFRFMCILLSKCSTAISAILGSPSHLKTIFSFLESKKKSNSSTIERGMAALMLAVSLEVTDEDMVPKTSKQRNYDTNCSFDSDVMKLVRNGLGLEKFSDLLDGLMSSNAMKCAKSDVYATPTSSPTTLTSTGNATIWDQSTLFDFAFRTFAEITQETARRQLIASFTAPRTPSKDDIGSGVSGQNEEVNALTGVLEQYKELIRVQDKDIEKLKKALKKLKREHPKEHDTHKEQDTHEDECTYEDVVAEGLMPLPETQSQVQFSPGILPGSSTMPSTVAKSDPPTPFFSEVLQNLRDQCEEKDTRILELEMKLEVSKTDGLIHGDVVSKGSKANQGCVKAKRQTDELEVAAEEIVKLYAQIADLEDRLRLATKNETKRTLFPKKSDGDKNYEVMYTELHQEHVDLLVVLANQEIENQALTDQLIEEVGESAVQKARQVATIAFSESLKEV